MLPVQVINGGEVAANALLYRQPSETLTGYIRNGMNSILTTASSLSDRFINATNTIYNKVFDNEVIKTGKMLLNSVGMSMNLDNIYAVPYESIRSVNPIMQQYIMCNPIVNEAYNKNRCYGYQDTYFDFEPDSVGEERNDYQRVMDGVLQFDNEGQGLIKFYSNHDDTELSLFDKVSILDTWDVVARCMAEGMDPTEPE